jgi:hypothetical protein
MPLLRAHGAHRLSHVPQVGEEALLLACLLGLPSCFLNSATGNRNRKIQHGLQKKHRKRTCASTVASCSISRVICASRVTILARIVATACDSCSNLPRPRRCRRRHRQHGHRALRE